MAVALLIALLMDNTMPGTWEERGLHHWNLRGGHRDMDSKAKQAYDLPFGCAGWLQGDGAVTLVTDPPGAEVHLERCEGVAGRMADGVQMIRDDRAVQVRCHHGL